MTTTRRRRCLGAVLALALAAVVVPGLAQSIEAWSQDALEVPGARQYGVAPDRNFGMTGREHDRSRPDLEAESPEPPRGLEYSSPYGGYGTNGYGRGDGGTGAGTRFGGEFGEGGQALVAPFGGGPGNRTPIPLGTGSLYGGSAVNGTAVGPQYSNQLPAHEGRFRR